MRRSIELGVLLVSVLLALSIFVALAENQTASKDKLNATKMNTTNGTINATAENTTASSNLTAKNMTVGNNTTSKNVANPFAKVKGKEPDDSDQGP